MVICGGELGALLYDELPSLCYGVFTPVALEWVLTQLLVLMQIVVDFPPKSAPLLFGTIDWICPIFTQPSQMTKSSRSMNALVLFEQSRTGPCG
jgi:hypothetical protein